MEGILKAYNIHDRQFRSEIKRTSDYPEKLDAVLEKYNIPARFKFGQTMRERPETMARRSQEVQHP